MLKSLFEQHDDPVLDATSRWADINEIFKDNQSWEGADLLDRLIAFEEFIKEIDRKEFNQRKKERQRK